MQMEINFVLGKNEGNKPSGLGGRLIVVVSEWDEILVVNEFLKLQFSSTFRLLEWICGVNNFVQIDLWLVFKQVI